MAEISDRTLFIIVAVTAFAVFIGWAYGLLTRSVPVIPSGADFGWLGLGVIFLVIVALVWYAARVIDPWGTQDKGGPGHENR